MNKTIRVLHVFGRLDSGGAESRTMDIYRKIDKTKVQFDFAIHTDDKCFFTDEVSALGGKIYCFPRFNGKNYFDYKRAWNLFFKEHPEYKIVHGHQTNTGFVYLNEARKNNVPVRIAHARNSNKENIIKKYICKLTKLYATHLFAVSQLAGISEFGRDVVDKGFVKIIPNAIEALKYSFDKEMRDIKRKELGIENKFVVSHIGRFHSQKNHSFLLETFKLIVKNNKDAVLVLIGDGPLRNEIEQQISDFGIDHSVILTGIRTDVPELLQAMDILLFPSHFEGLPGVVLEAQAAGLPCVISDKITNEVKITDLVEYVSLDKSAAYWAEKVMKFSQSLERRNTYNAIVEAGYDTEAVANWYQDFYIKTNKT
ncbi:glycosyltransferase family 1 protein [Dethiobacter alkaliphilus]|uniref:Glycosyl transferase group 1 n=1 Tax=Dethiobacter alkaliphilus AHT 1 TaxID=555088 RepID=C0GGQ6_DETAL|nr:glycosyltransferase family 1 protein [Dethiobacter alkaliphilus]EEG77497.1 glycosyl transferase group 1 [Dethiobacter alkaliphilus AHT 1]